MMAHGRAETEGGTMWQHDTSSDFEWYTRPDMEVGAMRGRGPDGRWEAWTIAYVSDGYPAGGTSDYMRFSTLREAKAAAEREGSW